MASTQFDSSSDGYVNILEQARQNFWNSHAYLSEEERQASWMRAASAPSSNATNASQQSMAQQTPRTMRDSMSNLTDLPPPNFGAMDCAHSAPGNAHSVSALGLISTDLERCPTSYSDWQCTSQEPASDYALYSENAPRHQYGLQPIDEGTCLSNGNGMVEYSPVDYVSSFVEPMNTHSLSIPTLPHSQLQQGQLTTNQWCSSSDGSASPSTPLTALMTPITQSSDMSRQSSYDANFIAVSMLPVHSDSSCMLPIPFEDGSFPFSFDAESKAISVPADGFQLSHLTDSSEGFLSSSLHPCVSASAHGLASIETEQSDLAEDMWRSASTSSRATSTSDASMLSSSCSRHSQRDREVNAHAASRKIAPKAVERVDEDLTSLPCNAQMARIQSSDGTSKTVGLLTKTPYVRPAHPKIMCQFCNERPDGFRGTHELERHVARSHAPSRKGYICIDASTNGKFLANCKHCRGKKVYGAYYNAAAHLRRAHFHPRKRGRKGKNDEKRGGIGGGDDPPMDYLKQNWIREIEVTATLKKSKKSSPACEPSCSVADAVSDSFNDSSATVVNAIPAASSPQHQYQHQQHHQQHQQQQQMPTSATTSTTLPPSLDPSLFLNYETSSLHASDPPIILYSHDHDHNHNHNPTPSFTPFDPTLHMVVPTDMRHFQFDADAATGH